VLIPRIRRSSNESAGGSGEASVGWKEAAFNGLLDKKRLLGCGSGAFVSTLNASKGDEMVMDKVNKMEKTIPPESIDRIPEIKAGIERACTN
jgi:hypothetical protein